MGCEAIRNRLRGMGVATSHRSGTTLKEGSARNGSVRNGSNEPVAEQRVTALSGCNRPAQVGDGENRLRLNFRRYDESN